MDKDELNRYWLKFRDVIVTIRDFPVKIVENYFDYLYSFVSDPTLEDTIVEKIGGGPHGYGDPADTSIRTEETYLFPPMIWRKVRFEKCLDVTEKFYKCVESTSEIASDCKAEELAMHQCKSLYYNPEKIDEVENECIQEYIKLRSKFRESGSEEDLWKIKMMILDPSYDKIRKMKKKQSV